MRKCEFCESESDEIYCHSRCHPDQPAWAIFNQTTAILKLECSVCKKEIVKFKVALVAGPESKLN